MCIIQFYQSDGRGQVYSGGEELIFVRERTSPVVPQLSDAPTTRPSRDDERSAAQTRHWAMPNSAMQHREGSSWQELGQRRLSANCGPAAPRGNRECRLQGSWAADFPLFFATV